MALFKEKEAKRQHARNSRMLHMKLTHPFHNGVPVTDSEGGSAGGVSDGM